QNACRRLYRISRTRGFACNRREKTSNVLCFAFDFRTQNEGIELELAGLFHCRIHEQAIVRDHVVIDILENRISRLWSFRDVSSRALLKAFLDRVWNIEAVFLNDRKGVRKRRGVRSGRAGSDEIDRISN